MSEFQFGPVRVVLELGDLFTVPAQAIVVPTNSALALEGTRIGKRAVERHTPLLEGGLAAHCPAATGSVIVASPRRQKDKYLFLAVLTGAGNPGHEAVLRGVLHQICQKTEALGLEQVALPALGTGEMGLDPATAAQWVMASLANADRWVTRPITLSFAFIDPPYLWAFDEAARRHGRAADPRAQGGSAGRPRCYVMSGELFAREGASRAIDAYLVHALGSHLEDAARAADEWSGHKISRSLSRKVYRIDDQGAMVEDREGGDIRGEHGECVEAAPRLTRGGKHRPGLYVLGLGARSLLTLDRLRSAHREWALRMAGFGLPGGAVLALTVPRPRTGWSWGETVRAIVLGLLEGFRESPQTVPREVRLYTRDPLLVDPLARGVAEAEREIERTPTRQELHPGDVVGKYEILEEHPRGQEGRHFRARDRLLGREVHLVGLEGPQDLVEAALARARSLCNVHHPAFATLHELFEHEGRYYIAREGFEGEKLGDRLRREGPLPLPEVVRIARVATDLLREVHSKGATVLALHPETLRLAGERVLALYSSLYRPASYAAPEERQGAAPTPTTDYHSLGLLLLDMATGERAEGEDPAAALADPARAARLPPGLRDLVRDLTRDKPEERLTDPARVLAALDALETPARPRSPEQAARFRHRVETSFPTPIAWAFGRLSKSEGEDRPHLDDLASLLEEWLRFQAALAVRDLVASARGPIEPALVSEILAPRPTAGRLCGMARECWKALAGKEHVLPALGDLWRDDGFRSRVDEAVTTRNRLHQGGAPPATAAHLKTLLVGLLADSQLLADSLLLVPAGSETRDGARTLKARLWRGRDESQPLVRYETAAELETGIVWFGLPEGDVLLPLEPLIWQERCPECGEEHLWCWEGAGDGKLQYQAVGSAHRMARKDLYRAFKEELARGAADRAPVRPGRFVGLDELASFPDRRHPGEKIGPYEVRGFIARGGMADVYEVLDPRVQPPRRAAMKLLSYQLARVRELVARHRREVAELQRIVHRDLKPSNILLFPPDRLKVADFGVARGRVSVTFTLTGLAVGTPEYMSPEQAEETHDRRVDHRSDLYSLGVLLYELLAGDVPFRGLTPLATLSLHRTRPAPPLGERVPGLPEAFARLVHRLLAKEPGERPASGKAAWDELQAILGLPATPDSA